MCPHMLEPWELEQPGPATWQADACAAARAVAATLDSACVRDAN